MIFQIHEQHGKHIAYSDTERLANESNGWATVSEDEFYGRPPAIEGESEEINEDELSDREKLNLEYEIKFGKKPHHAMKIETIQAKLDE